MTNNKLCDIIGCAGCLISFLCMVAIFFGANCWIGIIIGVLLMLISMWEYEK